MFIYKNNYPKFVIESDDYTIYTIIKTGLEEKIELNKRLLEYDTSFTGKEELQEEIEQYEKYLQILG